MNETDMGKNAFDIRARVARWFVFEPKIPLWVNNGGPWIGQLIYILWPFGIFYGDLGYL
jgi:hypothetical protein